MHCVLFCFETKHSIKSVLDQCINVVLSFICVFIFYKKQGVFLHKSIIIIAKIKNMLSDKKE